MTTRLTALTVILEGEPREDDVADLVAAIRRLRGVADVQPIEMSAESRIAEHRAKLDLRRRIFDLLRD